MAFSENTKTEIQIRKFKAKTILLFFRENRMQIGWKFCRRYLRRKISTILLKRMLTIICMVKSPKKKLWMQSYSPFINKCQMIPSLYLILQNDRIDN